MTTKLIWRSDSGQRAWESAHSGLPAYYRRILDVCGSPTPAAKLVEKLADYSIEQICDWLDELETLGFIHASRVDRELADPRNKQAA